LNQVPTLDSLEALDVSRGFHSIVFSCTGNDFFLYVMGGNTASLEFLADPLPRSSQPPRPYLRSEGRTIWRNNPEIFDIALAARYVAWNCLRLGWTAERFEQFDTGEHVRGHGRISEEGRTERIGKKYQWIGWYECLAFLFDNYKMRPDWDKKPGRYDDPSQLRLELFDPARWLQTLQDSVPKRKTKEFWQVPNFPPWPRPDASELKTWIKASSFDFPPSDLISWQIPMPADSGNGPWLRIAAEHIWSSDGAPGYWASGRKYMADLWWQSLPFLIQTNELPKLLEKLATSSVQGKLAEVGRVDPHQDWNLPLGQWSVAEFEEPAMFRTPRHNGHDFWLPIPWRPMVGKCGHPDRKDDHAPIVLPLPSLFREWNLELNLRHGTILGKGDVLFGVAGWVFGESALFARLEPLKVLLEASGYTLVWWWRGERRAFLDLTDSSTIRHEGDSVWADYHGIGYLGQDGRVQTASMTKILRSQ
jgi:hypothetical protein